jgi:hypothetical protein
MLMRRIIGCTDLPRAAHKQLLLLLRLLLYCGLCPAAAALEGILWQNSCSLQAATAASSNAPAAAVLLPGHV